MKHTLVTTFLLLGATPLLYAQNVGIGKAATLGRLEVYGAVGSTAAIFGGDGAGVSIQRNPPSIGFNQYNIGGYTLGYSGQLLAPGYGMIHYLDMSTGALVFDVTGNGTEPNALIGQARMLAIQQNGNVKLGSSNLEATLSISTGLIKKAVFAGTQLLSEFNSNTASINPGKTNGTIYVNDKASGDVYIGFDSTRFGINKTSPTDVLHVRQTNGRGLALINPNFSYWEMFTEKNLTEDASDLSMYCNGNNLGNFYNGNGTYSYYSDRRLKTNIRSLDNILPKTMQLQPYTYRFAREYFDEKSMGFLAQDVAKLFPELTERMPLAPGNNYGLPELHMLSYDGFGTIAIKSIQEQQKLLRELERQVLSLTDLIEQSEKILKELKTKQQPTRQLPHP